MTEDDDDAVAERLYGLETELYRDDARRSRETLEALLDDGFTEVAANGQVFDKRRIIEALLGEVARVPWEITDYETTPLAAGVVLARYRLVRHGEPPSESLRSSVWCRRDAGWRVVFHQGTPRLLG